MKRKRLIKCSLVLLFIIKIIPLCYGQIGVRETDVTRIGTKIRSEINENNIENLITEYTFRKVFAEEYSNVLLGENAFSSATRYATLKIDEKESSVAFSPFVFLHKAPEQGKLRFFGNLSFKGEVNSSKIATIFGKDGFASNYQVALNLNTLLGRGGISRYSFNTNKEQFRERQNSIIDNVITDYTKIVADATNDVVKEINNRKTLKDEKSLEKAMRNSFSSYEKLLAEPEWVSRYKFWITTSLRFGQVQQAVYNTKTEQIEKINYSSPSLLFSPNIFFQSGDSKWNAYGNVSAEISRKNVFTGTSTDSYNVIDAVTGTSLIIKESENVYVYDDELYNIDYAPTYGFQGIVLYNNDSFPIGINLIQKREKLVVAPGLNEAHKHNRSIGVIFPFNDKKGERTINIEVFYSKNTYTNNYKDKEELWGARFAVPIFSK